VATASAADAATAPHGMANEKAAMKRRVRRVGIGPPVRCQRKSDWVVVALAFIVLDRSFGNSDVNFPQLTRCDRARRREATERPFGVWESSMTVQIIRGFVAAALIIAACPVHGEEARCGEISELSTNPAAAVGHITSGAPRVPFIKDASTQPGCPNTTPACTERAYLIPGDRVILTAKRDAFVCATYISARGNDRSGWLPSDAVAYDKPEPVALAGWLGKWSRTEAEIRVKLGKTGALLIEGDATFGALDPGRVKRGAVNAGEISAEVTPAGDRLSFAIGAGDTLPVDKGDEFDCKVWMRRVGPWLIVNDNRNCGGFNVSFRGFYTRKP
jgi:hypothetical protein